MPVTAKFSEEFYRALGHRQVDELVNWLNQVDATNRSELRELFELHFGRFDAKLEQRVAEVRAELRQEIAELRGELRGEFRAGLAGVESRLTMRMFLFWVATVGVFFAQKLLS
jgi:hypothetical protein